MVDSLGDVGRSPPGRSGWSGAALRGVALEMIYDVPTRTVEVAVQPFDAAARGIASAQVGPADDEQAAGRWPDRLRHGVVVRSGWYIWGWRPTAARSCRGSCA